MALTEVSRVGRLRHRRVARRSGRSRVLITEGDNVGVLAMVRGLAQAGYEPWVACAHSSAPAARSRLVAGARTVADPGTSRRAFAFAIAEMAAAIDPVAVLPGGEKGLMALAELAETGVPPVAPIGVCSTEAVAMATDKGALAALACSAGLSTPATFACTAAEAAGTALPLELPLIVKPTRTQTPTADGFLACPVRMACSREEVIAALRALPGEQGLLQRHHRGHLTGVGGVFWDGRIVAAVHQRAVRTYPVGCGEMSYAVALPRDGILEARIARLLGALRWRGLFQLQFLETDRGRLLIDLNPRVYGSLALALAAGQNLPAIWVDLIRGRAVQPAPYRDGATFRNEFLDARAILAGARLSGDRPRTGPVAARADAYAFFGAGDPMPFVAIAPMIALKLRARGKLHHKH